MAPLCRPARGWCLRSDDLVEAPPNRPHPERDALPRKRNAPQAAAALGRRPPPAAPCIPAPYVPLPERLGRLGSRRTKTQRMQRMGPRACERILLAHVLSIVLPLRACLGSIGGGGVPPLERWSRWSGSPVLRRVACGLNRVPRACFCEDTTLRRCLWPDADVQASGSGCSSNTPTAPHISPSTARGSGTAVVRSAA